jgi:hypothetical protein
MSDACTGSFQGDVVDFQSGAAVTLVHIEASGGDPKTKLTVNAAPDGGYASDSIPCGPYALQISAPGYYPTTIYAHVDAKTTTQIVQLKAIPDSMCSGTGSATGLVFDALTKERKPIAGATLSIEPGVGAAGVGPVMFETQSGADGRFSVSELSSGYYTAAVSAPGFAAGQLTLMVCGGSTRMDQDIALTPRMDGVAMRVILTWKQPNDLDLHAQLPDGNELYFYTPCRGMQQSYPYASLDVDRKMANGPETVSFARFQPGTYTFFVHNYSEQIEMAKQHLSASAAEVVVLGMGDQELGRFAVPSTGSGVFWDVFSIEGTAPSQLHPIQSINNARANPETGYSQDCRP